MGNLDRKNEKKSRGKKYWLLLLLIIVIGTLMLVTVSYTVGSAVLKIVGFNTTQIVNWDVRIDNVSTDTVGSAKIKRGTVELTAIKDFVFKFAVPGDSATMTFDIINRGNLNAKLDYFDFGKLNCTYNDGKDASDYCKNVYYVVEYANGKPIKVGDTLDAGQNRKVKVTLKYYDEALPLIGNSISIDDIDITFIFSQK